MVSTSYPRSTEDWQGRFIADMVDALAHRADVDLALWAPPGERPEGVRYAATTSESDWLSRVAAQGGIASKLRGNRVRAAWAALGLITRLACAYRREKPGLAHVNWLQNALPLWGTKTPLLVTVLGSDFGLLRLPGMSAMLRAVFMQRPTVIAPNAAWMKPTLERLFADVALVRPVPFGVDARWFQINRHQIEPQTWLAVTRITRDKIGDLFEWGEGLFGGTRQLHLFGPMQEPLTLPPWVSWHGPTHPAELRERWFPRATGLITLSRHHEGRPQVMLEAMAAGVPIIASDLPAHRDFVHHEMTGWLVQDRQAFGVALRYLEAPQLNRHIGKAAQRWVKETIGDWDDCAARYRELYAELLAE